MNREDFRRNFARSYFALSGDSALVQEAIKLLGVKALPPGSWVPCTRPDYFVDGGQLKCQTRALLPTPTGSSQYLFYNISFRWKDDMDEDSAIMDCAHPRYLGMIQGVDTVMYVRRQAQRQYYRGYAPALCSGLVPNMSSLGEEPPGPGSLDIIWAIYNPMKESWDSALQTLERGDKIGVVVDTWLAVFIEAGKRYSRIYYRGDVVGYIQGRMPVLYPWAGADCIDYIYKITGILPTTKQGE